MSYTKTEWTKREGVNLNKYTKTGENANEVILTNAPDSITEAGTEFTVDRMNNIEKGIDDIHNQDVTLAGKKTFTDSVEINKTDDVYLIANTNTNLRRAGIIAQYNGLNRWLFGKNNASESTGDIGSDFIIQAYADDGSTVLGNYLKITRETGQVDIDKNLVVGETITAGSLSLNKTITEISISVGGGEDNKAIPAGIWTIKSNVNEAVSPLVVNSTSSGIFFPRAVGATLFSNGTNYWLRGNVAAGSTLNLIGFAA